QQQELGFAFFMAFTVFCVGSMGLIGPVLTANAIGAEKLAKTLPVLLMTPIGAWQIVSGKLFSSVLAALTLLGLSLPVLALVRLLGGVEVGQMLAVLALAVAFVVGCAAIGLFFSLYISRPAVVILLSYATLGVLYFLIPFVLVVLFEVGKGGPRAGSSGILFLAALHPFGCAVGQVEPFTRTMLGNTWVATVLVQLGLAAGLSGLTAVLLRRQARGGGDGPIPAATPAVVALPPPLSPATAAPTGTADAAPAVIAYAGPAAPLARESSRAAARRDVSDNPVLWRELRRPLLAKRWQRVVGALAVVAVLLLVYAMLAEERALKDADTQGGFACVLFGLWWLLAAVLSATAIASEKESDTWTLLLTTPMTGRQIVWGKAAGMFRRMLWPTVLIAVHFSLFAVGGVIPLWAVGFAVVMTVACNGVWVATGIYLSLRLRKATAAVIANLMLGISAYALVPLAILIPTELLRRGGDPVAEHVGWYIPYMYLAMGFEGVRRMSPGYAQMFGNVRYGYDQEPFWLPGLHRVDGVTFFGFAAACAIAHLLVGFVILQRTADGFDAIVGRAGRRRFVGLADTDESVLSATSASALDNNAVPGRSAATSAPVQDGPRSGRSHVLPATAAATAEAYASVPRRFAAWAVDVMLVGAACGLGGLVWGVIAVVSSATESDMSDDLAATVLGQHLVAAAWAAVGVGWLYSAGFESSRRRATPGKMLFGAFVTDAGGRRSSFARASGRYAGKLVSAVPFGAGYVVALFTGRRRALHDLMAGTLVLRR
ncbi:MAG: hypothetical protein JWO31_1760, partial [Phycisphaerales bacterium]|nr:hypothetical protein [Phycisphaerales bacterium]